MLRLARLLGSGRSRLIQAARMVKARTPMAKRAPKAMSAVRRRVFLDPKSSLKRFVQDGVGGIGGLGPDGRRSGAGDRGFWMSVFLDG